MALKVYSRTEWGARPYSKPPTDNTITSNSVCFLHHSEFPTLPATATVKQEIARMKDIEAVHMDERGWSAIAYSYIVFPSGRVYTGRGFRHVPAAQYGFNAGHGAICFDGNFGAGNTTWAARKSAILLLRGRFSEGGFVGIHRQVNDTSCPGDNLAAQLGRISTFSGKKKFAP